MPTQCRDFVITGFAAVITNVEKPPIETKNRLYAAVRRVTDA